MNLLLSFLFVVPFTVQAQKANSSLSPLEKKCKAGFVTLIKTASQYKERASKAESMEECQKVLSEFTDDGSKHKTPPPQCQHLKVDEISETGEESFKDVLGDINLKFEKKKSKKTTNDGDDDSDLYAHSGDSMAKVYGNAVAIENRMIDRKCRGKPDQDILDIKKRNSGSGAKKTSHGDSQKANGATHSTAGSAR